MAMEISGNGYPVGYRVEPYQEKSLQDHGSRAAARAKEAEAAAKAKELEDFMKRIPELEKQGYEELCARNKALGGTVTYYQQSWTVNKDGSIQSTVYSVTETAETNAEKLKRQMEERLEKQKKKKEEAEKAEREKENPEKSEKMEKSERIEKSDKKETEYRPLIDVSVSDDKIVFHQDLEYSNIRNGSRPERMGEK